MTGWAVEWTVTDRDGAAIGVLAGDGGQITWDGRATVGRVARGVRFPAAEWADVNPFTDWLVPVLRSSDGSAYRLGMFTVVDAPARFLAPGVPDAPQVYMMDGGALLATASQFTLTALVGESLSDAMARVCDAAGVTRRVIDVEGDLVGDPVAYPPGTTFATALDGFTSLAGFLPPHFDRDGVLRLRRLPAGDAPDVTYGADTILSGSRAEESDLLTAPNVFVVVGAGSGANPVTATAELPVDAPNSVANRGGRRIVKVLREQGVSSLAQAQRLATRAAQTAASPSRSVTFDGMPDGRHDCWSLVEVSGTVFVESGWELPLRVGAAMGHRVESQVVLT